jgi:predicted dehydrogenase
MFKVAIIGCGSIGATKSDTIDGPESANILTHANAVSRHAKTELTYLVDSNPDILSKACKKWNPKFHFQLIKDLKIIRESKPDIVIVATPTESHFEVLKSVIELKPLLIIAEKPFCNNLEEALKIKEIAKNITGNIPIIVNYIRRFTPGIQNLKKEIDSGSLGTCLNTRILYTRGLRHEGCHAMDLMHYFFEEFQGLTIDHGNSIIDYSEEDLTCSVWAIFEKCKRIIFQPCDGQKYGIFEIDMCFENGRIRLIDNGLQIERYPITEENEWGHKSLNYKLTNVTRQDTNLNLAMYHLIDNAVKFLIGEEELVCTIDDAINVHKSLKIYD